MKRLLIGLFVVGCGAGGPGEVVISAEPEPVAEAPAPVDYSLVPLTHEIPGPPTEVLEAPPDPTPGAPTPGSGGCLPGYHEPPSKACCLLDVLPAGFCKCTEYDATGKVTVVGEQCGDSCGLNSDGIAEIHTFCVVGGLAADRVLR